MLSAASSKLRRRYEVATIALHVFCLRLIALGTLSGGGVSVTALGAVPISAIWRTLMNAVKFEQGGVRVDAEVIAAGFAIDPALVHALLREGKITSLCECGIDQDSGLYRLTFFHQNRRLRVVTDAAGNIIERSVSNRRERKSA
jgi:hypothetical protein